MPYEKRGQPLFLLLSELRVYLQHRGNKERDSTGAHDDYEEIAVAYRSCSAPAYKPGIIMERAMKAVHKA